MLLRSSLVNEHENNRLCAELVGTANDVTAARNVATNAQVLNRELTELNF